MMNFKLFMMLITILFVTIGTVIALSFHPRYRHISETIRQGEVYGFTIGEDKEAVFWRLSEMAAQDQIYLATVHEKKGFRLLTEVTDEFSDWQGWHILGSEGEEIHLSFLGDKLNSFYEFYGYLEEPVFLSSWPRDEEAVPHITPGMSYAEVYATLVDLSTVEVYQNIRVRPRSYKAITQFTNDALLRLKKQNEWYVYLLPFPYGEEQNYLFFRFKEGRLIELIRRKDAPDLLDEILSIFSKISRSQKS
jgi:hypothetical protein